MSSIIDRIETAIARGVLVQLHRSRIVSDMSWWNGYVHKVSPELVLLQPLSDRLDLDGYSILRIADISHFAVDYPRQEFHLHALAAKRICCRPPAPVDLSSMESALRSIEATYPLFVVHREIEDPEVCEVGRLKFSTSESYTLCTMSPEARWVDDPRHYLFSSITSSQASRGSTSTRSTRTHWRSSLGSLASWARAPAPINLNA